MPIVSYAQNFEDVMLWRALKHVENGFYIDIGAQDPIVDSVSLAFHEQGWQGIHVEPVASYAESLRQQRKGDTVIQAAVGSTAKILKFFEIPGTGLSTASSEIAREHFALGYPVNETSVASITLSSIFDLCEDREIHWLKVDVEGFEKQVLTSWGKSPARPWIVVVESTIPLTQIEVHRQWEPQLLRRQYDPAYFDGLNRFYVSRAHPELAEAFRSPPNLFDEFALSVKGSSRHHFAIHEQLEHQRAAQSAESREERDRFSTMLSEREAALQELQRDLKEQRESAAQELRTFEQKQLDRTREQEEAAARIQSQLQAALQALAEREREAGSFLLNFQQQSEQRISELNARLISLQERAAEDLAEHDRNLQAEIAEHEQNAAQSLQAARATIEKLQAERALQANEYAAKLEELRREYAQREEVLRLGAEKPRLMLDEVLKTLALREQENGLRLLSVKREAESDRHAQLRLADERLQQAAATHIERESALNAALQSTRRDLASLSEEGHRREQKLAAELAASGWKLQDALKQAARHEAALKLQLRTLRTLEDQFAQMHDRLSTTLHSELPLPQSLDELLAYYDVDFVRNAYRALLMREPDHSGEKYYLSLIRRGYDRVQILGDIRYSEEGRGQPARLAGLDRALRMLKLSRVPALSAAIRFMRLCFPAPPRIDSRAAFRNQSMALLGESLRHLGRMSSLMLQLQTSTAPLLGELSRIAEFQALNGSALDQLQAAVQRLHEEPTYPQRSSAVHASDRDDSAEQPLVPATVVPQRNGLREVLERQMLRWKR